MALNLDQKKQVVAEVAAVASKALSLVAAKYDGITVGQLTELRKKAREQGVYLRVVKNSLVERAVADTDFACIQGACRGQLLFAFSKDDPGAAGRLIKDAVKANDKLKTQIVAVGGKLYGAAELERLASLPTREQALSMFIGVLVQPIIQLVRTLAEPASRIARVVNAVAEQKKAA